MAYEVSLKLSGVCTGFTLGNIDQELSMPSSKYEIGSAALGSDLLFSTKEILTVKFQYRFKIYLTHDHILVPQVLLSLKLAHLAGEIVYHLTFQAILNAGLGWGGRKEREMSLKKMA